MFMKSSISLNIAHAIINKIEKRVNNAIYLKEIDSLRYVYQIEQALMEGAECCRLNYNFTHD
jgi:hypothetical protein